MSNKGTQTATTKTRSDEEPDERDREELEQARQNDSRHGTKATVGEKAEELPEEDGDESEEVTALTNACQKFQDKITWHEGQIEFNENEIKTHQEQIEELRTTLRKKFTGLVGEITGSLEPQKRKPGRPPNNGGNTQQGRSNQASSGQGSRSRTNYGDGNSTGDLIAACLKKSRKPVNTEQLTQFLVDHGNNTNPSVELSRMVGKKLVDRPTRGFYEWVGPKD